MNILKITGTFLVLIFPLNSCITKNVNKFELNRLGTISEFKIGAPEGFEMLKYTDDHGYQEHHYKYSDGSILYITDDIDSGSDFNEYKAEEYGDHIFLSITISDSIDIGGMHEKKYWREIKKDGVIFGYLNVPFDKKNMFDDVVENKIKPI